MTKTITVAMLLALLAAGCKKDDEKQYSTWYVNGEKFTTNDVIQEQNKMGDQMYGNNFSDRFYLAFRLGYFPREGQFFVNCEWPRVSGPEPHCCLTINWHGEKGYVNPQNCFVHANSLNGKGSYILPETWFYNAADSTDSVLISGIFNEP